MVAEAGMIPKQETVTLFSNLYVRTPKGLTRWVVLNGASQRVQLGCLGVGVFHPLWTCVTLSYMNRKGQGGGPCTIGIAVGSQYGGQT